MPQERNPSNFDFRVVALLTAFVTRPDLLHEYLADGKDKDHRGSPKALHDDTKWKRLRGFGFPAELLAEMLYLFEGSSGHKPEHPDDQKENHAFQDVPQALITMQRLFRTMVASRSYCPDECPDDQWFADFVLLVGKLTQPLDPAGVQIEK
jgi:hypothetical protein